MWPVVSKKFGSIDQKCVSYNLYRIVKEGAAPGELAKILRCGEDALVEFIVSPRSISEETGRRFVNFLESGIRLQKGSLTRLHAFWRDYAKRKQEEYVHDCKIR